MLRAPCTVLVIFAVMASALDGLSQAHHERVLELLNEREGDQLISSKTKNKTSPTATATAMVTPRPAAWHQRNARGGGAATPERARAVMTSTYLLLNPPHALPQRRRPPPYSTMTFR